MEYLMRIGITLTLILIGVSAVQTIAEGVGAQTFDVGSVAPTQSQLQSTTLDSNSEVSNDDYTAGVNAVASAWNSLFIFLGLIFNLMFGWTNVIQAIFEPVGLNIIGTALQGIFGFIQIGTILAVIMKAVASIRGSSG